MDSRPRLLAIVAAAAALVTGCDGVTDPVTEIDALRYAALLEEPALAVPAARDSAFNAQLRWQWSNTGFPHRGGRAARNALQWRVLFDSLQLGRTPKADPPAVDFDREMVVLALYGAAPTGGHYARIEHVTRVRDSVFVLAMAVRPAPSCVVTAAFTSWADVRLVPARPGPVVILFAPYVYDCARRVLAPDR